jgi:hypothetical protein
MDNVMTKGFCELNENEMMGTQGGFVGVFPVPLYGLHYDSPTKAAALSGKVVASTFSGFAVGGPFAPVAGAITGLGSLAILATADVINGDASIVAYGIFPLVV